MTCRPFFSYYGSKFAKAHRYPTPAHDTIVEPFAGSAGYSLRFPDRNVYLYDVNEKIVGVWRYLLKVSREELLALPDLCKGQTVDDFRIPQEAKWLIGWWCAPQTSRPSKKPSSWMLSGARPNGYWGSSTRQRLAAQLHTIRHWTITHGSYEQAENIKATWFVDPPYKALGRTVYHSLPNFDHLSSWCRSRLGQVIVCEQVGANWLPFEPVGENRTRYNGLSGWSGKTNAREAVWVGGE